MAKTLAVFVVDHDPDARFQMQRLVEAAECSVSGDSGPGTEAVVLASERQPDIVLCAVREPVARATQTIESLVHALPQTPVIAYAELNGLETIRQAMLAGARDFLRAPFSADELRRSLVAAFESEERRQLRNFGSRVLGPQGVTIAVFGAKGGVGKTTVATNLGVALARAGEATVLVDGDDTFGDVTASLAVTPQHTLQDALRCGTSAFGDDGKSDIQTFLSYHDSGLAILPGPANPFEWRGIGADEMQQVLRQLARKFDVVLVDTASSLGDRALAVLQSATVVLWVTSTDYASVRDSQQALQAIRSLRLLPEERLRLVLNVTSPETEVRKESVEGALERPVFWTIPYDPELRRGGQLGRPAVDSHPESPAPASLVALARTLVGQGEPERQEHANGRRFFPHLSFGRGSKTARLRMQGEVLP